MNILAISTTTHSKSSTSKSLLSAVVGYLRQQEHEVRYLNADDLHIVKNLSCYAGGKSNCAHPDAGEYRCWAHKLSHENPSEYGGKDEMPLIYDGIAWADVVIFSTSVRWGSHSALMQSIIERLNTLENRHSVYGEKNPLQGKKCGVVVTGHNAKAQEVASHLLEMFSWIGFETSVFSRLVWQKSQDLKSEVDEDSDFSDSRAYVFSQEGSDQIKGFLSSLL
jgi:multimeric flavodoxin WrbA